MNISQFDEVFHCLQNSSALATICFLQVASPATSIQWPPSINLAQQQITIYFVLVSLDSSKLKLTEKMTEMPSPWFVIDVNHSSS